jgi:Domain of unknown function (DUF4439)
VTGRAAAARLSGPSVAALQTALAAEQAASYGYGVAGAHLTGTSAQAAGRDWIAHQVQRDKLTAMIAAAGAAPVPAPVAYQLPIAVQTPEQARALAVLLEDSVAQAYMGLVGLTDGTLRALGTAQVTAAALRAAAWRRETVAFPGLPAGSLRG